jgi:hypothetical protein
MWVQSEVGTYELEADAVINRDTVHSPEIEEKGCQYYDASLFIFSLITLSEIVTIQLRMYASR